jgi:uncharacterized protein DUF6886
MPSRAPAPPYAGEGPHALWHASEDDSITVFRPRRSPAGERLVWAVDTRHLPLFWFPRECPRCTFWAGDATTGEDVDAFLGDRRVDRAAVVDDLWPLWNRVVESTLEFSGIRLRNSQRA